jgi:AraC-like DNA-binding protein
MLFAAGQRRIGSARLAWSLAFSGSLWWFVVEREGLVLDTRWIPGARSARRPQGCVYLLLGGTFDVHGPAARTIEAPAALVLSEEQFEGALGARPVTYRTSGEPFAAIQLHVPEAMLAVRPSIDSFGSAHTHELGAPAWSAAREVAVACRSSAEASLEPMRRLIVLLGDCGILREDAMQPSAMKTPAPLTLLWQGIRPIVERLNMAPTVDEISTATGMSVRQIEQRIGGFLARFDVGGAGWRAATLHLRLKVAVVLLSAERISVAEVAETTNYGSVDAMARAFRDAGLPPPSKVQAQLRGEDR